MATSGPQQGLTNRPRTRWDRYAECKTCAAADKSPCVDLRTVEQQRDRTVRSRPHSGRARLAR